MNETSKPTPWRETIKTIGNFFLLLIAIQIGRGLLTWGAYSLLKPTRTDSPIWSYIDIFTFTIIGLVLLLAMRPSPQSVGLEWKTARRWEKAAYVSGGILVGGLFITGTVLVGPNLAAANIASVVVFPIFEELLFRGWGWGSLEKEKAGRWRGLFHWLIISLLFGIWHFGYMDIYLLKIWPTWPDMQWGTFLLMKFLTAFLIGLFVGLPRWKTGRVYGAILLHMFINIFGR